MFMAWNACVEAQLTDADLSELPGGSERFLMSPKGRSKIWLDAACAGPFHPLKDYKPRLKYFGLPVNPKP